MSIHVSGHHIEVTPFLRNYVSEKLQRIEHHLDDITNVNVILQVEKLVHTAKANIHVKGEKLYAESEEENMYAAIDTLIDKLDRQAMKHKDKLHNHHTREE